MKAGRTTPVGLGIAKSLQLGQHLRVVLVVTRANNFSNMAFPTDELFAYDVEITDDVGKTMTLKDLGLISGKNSIIYQRATLPTSFLRGKDTPLNFLHGSCRKLHGKGKDCLAAADDVAGPLSH